MHDFEYTISKFNLLGPDLHRSAPAGAWTQTPISAWLASVTSHCSCFTKRPLTESRKNGVSYEFLWTRTTRDCIVEYFLLLISRGNSEQVQVRIRFSASFVSGYTHVSILLSVVTLPTADWCLLLTARLADSTGVAVRSDRMGPHHHFTGPRGPNFAGPHKREKPTNRPWLIMQTVAVTRKSETTVNN